MEPLIGNVWQWNILVAVVEVIYIFVVIGIMDKLVARGFPADLSRKIIHIAAGSYLMFWPLFNPTHGTKFLNVAMPLIWVLLFLSKGLSKNTADPAVKTMTRTGNPRELLHGPLMFAVIMVLNGLLLFNKFAGVVGMAILTWGDGLAPYFGQKFGRAKYRTLGPQKSYLGSLVVLVAGFIGAGLMLLVTQVPPTVVPWGKLLLLSLLAMVIEALSPRDVDNILIPVGVVVFSYLLLGGL
ncbi:phosphatidate cytidylyltransferase [candidate division KSB1 bacterium]|nr:phosphatidate cytidylyltransferase [candidate division KSB1 bacterium]